MRSSLNSSLDRQSMPSSVASARDRVVLPEPGHPPTRTNPSTCPTLPVECPRRTSGSAADSEACTSLAWPHASLHQVSSFRLHRRIAQFWAEALGSNVDEDATPQTAYVEAAGVGRSEHVVQRGAGAADREEPHALRSPRARTLTRRSTPTDGSWSEPQQGRNRSGCDDRFRGQRVLRRTVRRLPTSATAAFRRPCLQGKNFSTRCSRPAKVQVRSAGRALLAGAGERSEVRRGRRGPSRAVRPVSRRLLPGARASRRRPAGPHGTSARPRRPATPARPGPRARPAR